VEEERGDYTGYYARGVFEEGEKMVLEALRRKHARRILAHLLTYPGGSHGDLVDALGKAPSTVSWHLSSLKEEELVEKREVEEEKGLYVVEPEKVKRLYLRYERSFFDKLVDGMVELWDF